MRFAFLMGLSLFLVSLFACPVFTFDRINLLCIGQVVPETCPVPFWFESEPAATFTLVPTKIHWSMSFEEARRQVRLYFPRTRALTWDYDFFMYINPYFEPFTPSQIEYMYSAMVEGGSGGFQTLGGITIDSAEPNFAWLQSILAPIFPNDPTAIELWRHRSDSQDYRVILERSENLAPVLTPFLDVGIEEVPGYWAVIPMLPQEGATIWARAFGVYPKNDLPWLLSWQVDEGITWSLADDLDCPWWSSIYAPSEQKYGLDILMNVILYSLDKPLPQDIVLVNAVRRDFRTYKERTSTINSFIDFIEKFGANPNQIITDMLVVDATIEVAMEHYMEGRYDEALEKAEEAHSALAEFERRTMKLKSQALFWVYVTEWAVVSGTGLLVGYILFILMFRKILYKQVQVTRLGTEL